MRGVAETAVLRADIKYSSQQGQRCPNPQQALPTELGAGTLKDKDMIPDLRRLQMSLGRPLCQVRCLAQNAGCDLVLAPPAPVPGGHGTGLTMMHMRDLENAPGV